MKTCNTRGVTNVWPFVGQGFGNLHREGIGLPNLNFIYLQVHGLFFMGKGVSHNTERSRGVDK